MFCHKCGKEIEDGSAFCLYCGTKMPQNYPQDNPVNSNSSNSSASEECLNNTAGSSSVSEIEGDKNISRASNEFLEDSVSNDEKGIVSYDKPEDNLCKPIDAGKSWANNKLFSIPKFYHDVTINLGKGTIFCITAILIVVLISVCIIKCDTSNGDISNGDTSNISSNKLFNSSDEVTKPDSYENEVERWDAENCIYSNFKYGVAFALPNNMAWHMVSGTSKHTVVKFIQPDTQLALFVNINPIEGPSQVTDIWDVYEEYTTTVFQLAMNKANQISAEQLEDYHFKKAEFCGKHAIKTRYTSILGDDRYVEKKHLTSINYTFLYNNSTTTVSVKCFDDARELFNSQGITMEDFLKSFQLIHISNDK